ncbi:MAG TPA: hypothetical protein PKE69_08495 [Pyrinomonadaceae bacterium]|nr:hypothetical protein [Pyrinomonadaceae bacterium]
MSKSYKICHCTKFDKTEFTNNALDLNTQPHLAFFEDSPDKPITRITRYTTGHIFKDFSQYLIEHEHNVNVKGRYQDRRFNEFFRMGEINGYHSEKTGLFLMQGKKDDILDFCKFTDKSRLLDLNTIEIQMSDLLDKLGSVNNGWFKFSQGSIKTSALFGSHLESTDEFIAAKEVGDISALSFFYKDNDLSHAIMVTVDGTVVLQHNYPNTQIEIDLVLKIKKDLLDGIYNEVPAGRRKGKISLDKT